MRQARLADLERHAVVGHPRPADRTQTVGHEPPGKLRSSEVLRERLLADVRSGIAAGKDEIAPRMRRELLLTCQQRLHKRRQRDAVRTALLHLVPGNREDVTGDPRLSHLCGLDRPQKRTQ